MKRAHDQHDGPRLENREVEAAEEADLPMILGETANLEEPISAARQYAEAAKAPNTMKMETLLGFEAENRTSQPTTAWNSATRALCLPTLRPSLCIIDMVHSRDVNTSIIETCFARISV